MYERQFKLIVRMGLRSVLNARARRTPVSGTKGDK